MWRKFSLQFAPCTLQCSGLAARQKFKRTPEEEWFVDRKFLQWAELVMVMSVEKPSKMAKYWEWNLGATISRTTSRPKKLVKLFWIFCIKIILSENGKHPKKFHIIDSFLATSFFLAWTFLNFLAHCDLDWFWVLENPIFWYPTHH